MSDHKVFIVAGTRPEAIKMAPVYKAMLKYDGLSPVLISTGQHREMLKQVFDWFEIKPDEDLKVMTPNQTVNQVLSRSLVGLDELISKYQPDAVLAQGDTTTVLAAALAAFNNKVSFGHVEAGLRTHTLDRPYPEEGYRQMAARVAKWHFAPTQKSVEALEAENLSGDIFKVGNTVIDALLETASRDHPPVVDSNGKDLVLITGHRRENHDKFRAVFEAFKQLASEYPEKVFVYPVHLNPNVRNLAHEVLAGVTNFKLIEPVSYPEIVSLMKQAILILTDSGGIQEEAPSLKVPLLVMRETTERQESVDAGAAKLIGTDPDKIFSEARRLLDSEVERKKMIVDQNPFGDGASALRICKIIDNSLNTPS
ncbi:non-hydrolyzing UDP-N-acetylglucosamine 2-epimerase [Litorimonas haliclonae]|uniref:non-hydrolyzing UDP-N-acetylglucosamine 2-epimerase n=1 Tax=Litorimonas haliclonae TaxID=2081977 RepID=UPI0039EF161F